MEIGIGMSGFSPKSVVEHHVLAHSDLKAVNTAANPDNVKPEVGSSVGVEDGAVKGSLPPRPYHVLRVRV